MNDWYDIIDWALSLPGSYARAVVLSLRAASRP